MPTFQRAGASLLEQAELIPRGSSQDHAWTVRWSATMYIGPSSISVSTQYDERSVDSYLEQ